jgi:nicotinate-nucleotide adenylyltransferase
MIGENLTGDCEIIEMRERRVILFGGSFDPVHAGHIGVAEYARQYLGAERALLIAAGRSPHKEQNPLASGEHRLAMLRLAIEGHAGLEVSDFELTRPPPSYTYDTVAHYRKLYGESTALYWLLGADLVGDLGTWYRACELIDGCRIAVMVRGGYAGPDLSALEGQIGAARVAALGQWMIPTPAIDASSTEIRRRLAEGREPGDAVPAAVAAYIARNGLYGRPATEKRGG